MIIILIIITNMEIKINFDQIFDQSDTINLYHNHSIQPCQYSDTQQPYSTYQQKYKMNINIFQDSLTQLQQLQHQSSKMSSFPTNHTDICDKIPGERLYYQSKDYSIKKKQQLQKIKRQKAVQEEQQNTFKPKINKNTSKILNNKIKNPVTSKKTKISQNIPTKIKKQQQQYTHCTFKPQLISKFSSKIAQTKQKNNIFQQLYSNQKIKQKKLKFNIQQNNRINKQKLKKFHKEQFQQFLIRNNQFVNKVQKKHQLIVSASKLFDLQTGNKLFSPKINTIKSHKNYFSNRTELKNASYHQQFSPVRLQIKPLGIFSKNYQQSQQQQQNPLKSDQLSWIKINTNQNNANFNQIQQDEQQQKSQKGSLTSFGKHDELTRQYSSKLQPKVSQSNTVQKNQGDDQVQSTKNANSKISTPSNSSQYKSEGNTSNQFLIQNVE